MTSGRWRNSLLQWMSSLLKSLYSFVVVVASDRLVKCCFSWALFGAEGSGWRSCGSIRILTGSSVNCSNCMMPSNLTNKRNLNERSDLLRIVRQSSLKKNTSGSNGSENRFDWSIRKSRLPERVLCFLADTDHREEAGIGVFFIVCSQIE